MTVDTFLFAVVDELKNVPPFLTKDGLLLRTAVLGTPGKVFGTQNVNRQISILLLVNEFAEVMGIPVQLRILSINSDLSVDEVLTKLAAGESQPKPKPGTRSVRYVIAEMVTRD